MSRSSRRAGSTVSTGGAVMGLGLWGLLLAGPGCGYSLGYRAPTGVETIAIPIFQNVTFPLWREVEYEVTESEKGPKAVNVKAV